jgi:hypothetical protein
LKARILMPRFGLCEAVLLVALSVSAAPFHGQQTPAATAPSAATSRILGTVTALGPNSITVQAQTDGSSPVAVTLNDQTRILRVAPGEKTLQNAVPLTLADLAVGDRVLVRMASDSDPAHPTAGVVVAMKQAEISQVHEQESADWQKRGVSGIVQTVDPVSNTITMKTTAASPALIIHVLPTTGIRRYAPDSTTFADTRPSTLAAIHPGDQLRARGAKDSSGASLTAEEIVAGSFQDIAGTVLTADPATGTLSITDLATKKPLSLHLEASAQLRKLPAAMAARLAHPEAAAASAPGGQGAPHGSPETKHGAPDIANLLQHAPSIQLSDLKKGDAVMVVSSAPGAGPMTAITVVAGVEPLLQGSSTASEGLFSASWNLGAGDAASGDSAPQR